MMTDKLVKSVIEMTDQVHSMRKIESEFKISNGILQKSYNRMNLNECS